MAISKNSKRLVVTLPEDIHGLLVAKAEEENRTLSNMLMVILKKELETIRDEK